VIPDTLFFVTVQVDETVACQAVGNSPFIGVLSIRGRNLEIPHVCFDKSQEQVRMQERQLRSQVAVER
jgi:hypothetical protein